MRRVDSLVNFIIYLCPLLLGLLLILGMQVAYSYPPETVLTLTRALFICGLWSFLAAKSSVFRQGIRVSFGSGRMDRRNRFLYRMGYLLMVAGATLSAGLLAVA
jgi:hypothetical protein